MVGKAWNSWVNFGPKAEQNKGASGAATVYADQKVGLLPLWVSEDTAPSGYSIKETDDGFKPGVRRRWGLIEWPSLLRKLDKIDPSYRD